MVLSKISENEKKLVEDQLEIILASAYFHSAKQMRRFLEYIVEKTLAGEGDHLKQYTIGVEALAFPDDFDSDNNPGVRIMGGRVRTRLKEFYKNTDNNKIIINIPKGTYIPSFSYPDNFSKALEPKENINQEAYISTGPRLALISFSDKTQSNISNHLLLQTADALAEEFSHFLLLNLIVFNPLADRSESHGIGKVVDTDYALILYVQDLPRKKYELICRFAKEDSREVIWSESYKLNDKEAVAKQKEVVKKIIAATADIYQGILHTHWGRTLLLNKEIIPKQYKVLAYFRQYYDNVNAETLAAAASVCEEALKHNNNDIIANIIFSNLCRRDYSLSYDRIESALERGVECAERVINLKSDSHEAHYTLGELLFTQGEWSRSEHELNIARSLIDSHAAIQHGCGYFLCLMGKWDEGLLIVENSLGLSNTNPSIYRIPCFLSYYNLGDYQKALIEAKNLTSPNIPHGPLARCISYAQLGQIVDAMHEFEELVKIIPDMAENGKKRLLRLFGNEHLVEKIWDGLEKIN